MNRTKPVSGLEKARQDLNASKRSKKEIKVLYKDESYLMKILGIILFFNKTFMTNFITTIGSSVYFPSRRYVESLGDDATLILTHEFIHIIDSQRDPLFKIKYLFPQILAPLALLLIPVSWWALLLFFVLLLPLPAPWRKKYELRGYSMSLIAVKVLAEERGLPNDEVSAILLQTANMFDAHFKNGNYYFMWPWGVKAELQNIIHDIQTRDIFRKDSVFYIGESVMKNNS